MRTVLAVMAIATAVPAAAQDGDGGEIVVTAPGKPLKVDAKVFRAAQRRFAADRPVFAPAGDLRYELWRGGRRVGANDLSLAITDGRQRLPVTLDEAGRFRLPTIPEGRWYLMGGTAAQALTLRPVVLSGGTDVEHRRVGDLRAQCRVAVTMAKAQASILALPLIGMFDAIGGCLSKHIRFYHRVERPLASAVAGDGHVLPLSPKHLSYEAPLFDRTLGHDARVVLTYR